MQGSPCHSQPSIRSWSLSKVNAVPVLGFVRSVAAPNREALRAQRSVLHKLSVDSINAVTAKMLLCKKELALVWTLLEFVSAAGFRDASFLHTLLGRD